MKYIEISNGNRLSKLPEDIEKFQYLETLDVAGIGIHKLPASIIQLKRLVRLTVSWDVQLPDEIGNLLALEELSRVGLGSQSVKCIQGLTNLTNLKVFGTDWWYDDDIIREVEGHKNACISSLSKLFTSLQELRVYGNNADPTLSFMPSCVGTPPPLQRLILEDTDIVPNQISSLLNLTSLRIRFRGEVTKEVISILARLPILLSLTVYLYEECEDNVHPRCGIDNQGFQSLVEFTFHCHRVTALDFELGAMPKLQSLMLQLVGRYQFMYEHGGLILGLQNLRALKHVDHTVSCYHATPDEVEALENDIRGSVDAHPNRPMLQLEKYYQDDMAQGSSRRPSD
ncbi:unnamed protein product [Urochloa humidicola]